MADGGDADPLAAMVMEVCGCTERRATRALALAGHDPNTAIECVCPPRSLAPAPKAACRLIGRCHVGRLLLSGHPALAADSDPSASGPPRRSYSSSSFREI